MKLNICLFGALPARRVSKTRKRIRRTHLKKDAPTICKCKNCGEPLAPHRACTACGFYKGKDVLKHQEEVKEEIKEEKTSKKNNKKEVKTKK